MSGAARRKTVLLLSSESSASSVSDKPSVVGWSETAFSSSSAFRRDDEQEVHDAQLGLAVGEPVGKASTPQNMKDSTV